MAKVNNFNTRKRNRFLAIDVTILLPADESVDITSAEKSKGRVGVMQQPETEVEDFEYQMKTDDELIGMILRFKNNILTLGHKLPDKGEKIKATLRRCLAEVQRRKRSRVDKDETEEEEEEDDDDDDVKRMRRLRDKLEAEKNQANQVKGKLIDAETKIVRLEAHVIDLQKKLCDSSVQLNAAEEEKKELAKCLDVAERKCASVSDDSKWLLQEGLPFLVKRLVKELSKENLMTVSELRLCHQRSRSDSS